MERLVVWSPFPRLSLDTHSPGDKFTMLGNNLCKCILVGSALGEYLRSLPDWSWARRLFNAPGSHNPMPCFGMNGFLPTSSSSDPPISLILSTLRYLHL
jgi:hypothetical protein